MVKNKIVKMKTHKGLNKRIIRSANGLKVKFKPNWTTKYALRRSGRNRRRRMTRIFKPINWISRWKSLLR